MKNNFLKHFQRKLKLVGVLLLIAGFIPLLYVSATLYHNEWPPKNYEVELNLSYTDFNASIIKTLPVKPITNLESPSQRVKDFWIAGLIITATGLLFIFVNDRKGIIADWKGHLASLLILFIEIWILFIGILVIYYLLLLLDRDWKWWFIIQVSLTILALMSVIVWLKRSYLKEQ